MAYWLVTEGDKYCTGFFRLEFQIWARPGLVVAIGGRLRFALARLPGGVGLVDVQI